MMEEKDQEVMELEEELDAQTAEETSEGENGEALLTAEEGAEGISEESEEEKTPTEETPEELQAFESAEVEEKEFIEEDMVKSIIESVLFATEKPQSISVIKQAFAGTTVNTKQIRRGIESLMSDYASLERGVTIEEVTGGYQLRTKADNMDYLKRMVKARPFKLSGPALEVLAITAYKQPCAKFQVDEVRGVESGHLVRGLLDKGLLAFAGKSELPGKPMLYQTTRKFLEIFGLRNINELPSLSEIDQLLPDGIDPEDIESEKETLGDVAATLEKDGVTTYSEATEELEKITDKLSEISTSSEFFEQEKQREKERRDKEKADDIRERQLVGEEVSTREANWLARYDEAQAEEERNRAEVDELAEVLEGEDSENISEEEIIEGNQEVALVSSDEAPENQSETAPAENIEMSSVDEEAPSEPPMNDDHIS